MFESFVILKTSFKGLILFRMQRNFSMDDELKLIRHMQTPNQYIGAKSVEFKIKFFYCMLVCGLHNPIRTKEKRSSVV